MNHDSEAFGLIPNDYIETSLPLKSEVLEVSVVTKGRIPAICRACGKQFDARVKDIKRGFGKTCHLRCAGRLRAKPQTDISGQPRLKNGSLAALPQITTNVTKQEGKDE
jgi:hypothetical protein